MRGVPLALVAGVLVSASSAASGATIISFEWDSPMAVPNGFRSAHSSVVAFSDTLGEGLVVGNYDPQSRDQGLEIQGDDVSGLRMDFSVMCESLSVRFGNDDPRLTSAGDLAVLRLYQGAVLVGTSSVVMDRDDEAGQVVSFAGAAFDGAVFRYENALGAGIAATEIVDDVTFEVARPRDTVVVAAPVPSAVWAGLGLMGVLGVGRRHRA